jgi:uncharacterized membrane protein YqjE
MSDFVQVIHGLLRLESRSGTVLRGFENRAALAAVEIEEGKEVLTSAIVWLFVAMAAGLLVGLALTFLVAAVFWDTPHRVTALVVLALVELAVAVIAGAVARVRWRSWFPLEQTRAQLKKDSECLRQMFN